MEVRVLAYLVEQTPRWVPQEELLRHVWGYAPTVRSRTVPSTVHRLRQKIEPDPAHPAHLQSSAEGYRLRLPALQPPSLQLPFRSDSFVGRQDALDRLEALASGARRAALIVGPGGVGKSRLAEHFAHQRLEQGERVVFASGERCATAEDLLWTVAHGLEATSGTGLGQPSRIVALRPGGSVDRAGWPRMPVRRSRAADRSIAYGSAPAPAAWHLSPRPTADRRGSTGAGSPPARRGRRVVSFARLRRARRGCSPGRGGRHPQPGAAGRRACRCSSNSSPAGPIC